MPRSREVVIKQDTGEPIPVEVLAKSLIEFDKGVRRIEQAGLTRRAIALLLRDVIPVSVGLNLSQILAVLEYLPKLKGAYMKEPVEGKLRG